MSAPIEENSHHAITIVGAGLAGSMLAIYLAREGYEVDVYERRPDLRVADIEGGRSINLGLSARGIEALRHAGLAEAMLSRAVVMEGRSVHGQDGRVSFHPYGKNRSEVLHSIDRKELNRLLLDEAEACGARLHFEERLNGLDKETRSLSFRNEKTGKITRITSDRVIGADGAFSVVREHLQAGALGEFHQEWLPWGYKELHLPADAKGHSQVKLDSLHVWPRGQALVVSHPNLDGSHTLTLFLPFDGEGFTFNALTQKESVRRMFEELFPDLLPMAPDLVEQYFGHPTGRLVTIKTAPWSYEDWAVLVGDAVHAVYPFYGQGMNAALEDCVTLAQLIRTLPPAAVGWQKVFREFEHRRKRHTDTLAELSKQNFLELSQRLRSPWFVMRKNLDVWLNRLFPHHWLPLYTMVAHTTIPYADAVDRAERQERTLKRAALGAAALLAGTVVLALRRGRSRR